MNTSQTTGLVKPSGTTHIPLGTFNYMRVRNRQRFYTHLINKFEESGLKNSDLAKRMGRPPEVVSRWLSSPKNMRLDTISDILFAIDGGELIYENEYPLDKAPRNSNKPEWVAERQDEIAMSSLAEAETSDNNQPDDNKYPSATPSTNTAVIELKHHF